MPTRRFPDWLEAYLHYVDNSESPLSYHIWAGISTISSVLQRRVYMPWGHTTIYPNQYIILLGTSGVRKGEPITITRSMLAAVGVTVIPEYSTYEGLIKRIKKSPVTYKMDNKILTACAVSCVSEEFGVFLGDGRTQLLTSITNWYDNPDRWSYETKHGGLEEITGVCINILGAMAPDWIPLCIPQAAIGGGTTSRFIFIVEKHKRKTITNPNMYMPDKNVYEALVRDLEVISSLSGPMTFSPEALARYEKWYADTDKKAREGILPIQDPKFGGYCSRRATHVKKIGMALSASRGGDMIVHLEDFERALALMEQAEINMPETFSMVGSGSHTVNMTAVMDYLRARERVTRAELMATFYRDIDLRALENIEQTLNAMKCLRIEHDAQTTEVTYIWTGSKATERERLGADAIVMKDGKVIKS